MKTIRPPFRTLHLASCLFASLALGTPLTALGQTVIHIPGSVSFWNTETAVQGVSSHLVTNFNNTLLVGTQYEAELYYFDTITSAFNPLPSSLSSFKNSTTSRPGTWNGPSPLVALPAGLGGVDVFDDGTGEAGDGSGTGAGYYSVTLRVRAWDSTTGSSWESATVRGESASFAYTERLHSPPLSSDSQMLTQPGFQIQLGSIPPGISTQPKGQSGFWGKSVTFSVLAYGTLPLSYQWFKDGESISGETQSMLTLSNLDLSADGNYTVVINNDFGSITSNPALLILNAAGISMGLYPGITISGVVGNTYGIQYTTNLTQASSWVTLTNLTLVDPAQLWVDLSADTMAGTVPRRTYRVVAVP